MGFLNKLRGIPDEVARPQATAPPHISAVHHRGDFDLGSLPMPDAGVRAAVEDRQVIVAVKAYVKQANVGLAEAKHVVDAMVRGDRLVGGRAREPVEGMEPADQVRAEQMSTSADEEITRFIKAGQKIQAIKAHRVAYGTGLKESKDAVDALWDRIASE